MPNEMASYRFTPTIVVSRKERKSVVIHTGKIKGKNTNKEKGIRPPAGWKFDLAGPMNVRADGGEAGRCQGIAPNNRSENGVRVKVRLDRIKRVNIRGVWWDDGWVKCKATMTIYRIVETDKTENSIIGNLKWNGDETIKLPENIKSWELSIATFDGRKRNFSNSAEDQYYSIDVQGSGIILSPKPLVSF